MNPEQLWSLRCSSGIVCLFADCELLIGEPFLRGRYGLLVPLVQRPLSSSLLPAGVGRSFVEWRRRVRVLAQFRFALPLNRRGPVMCDRLSGVALRTSL
jgi:hypothetical protein